MYKRVYYQYNDFCYICKNLVKRAGAYPQLHERCEDE